MKIAPRTTFMELCEEKQVVGEYIIPAPTFLRDPGRQHTIASFKLGDSETIIDEMIYTSSFLKDTLTILPNAKERRFQLDINGSIGIHALVGYLKQMPTLCEKMNELAARIDAKKNIKELKVCGRGGTDFQAPVDYAVEHPEYDGLIIITDGCAPCPDTERLRTKLLWVIDNESSYKNIYERSRRPPYRERSAWR